jgi:hypothetical protein
MMTMRIRRSSLLVFLVVVASLPVASGNPLHDERKLTGKNGSNLRAKYVGKVEGGEKVEIRDSNAKSTGSQWRTSVKQIGNSSKRGKLEGSQKERNRLLRKQ